MKPVSHFFHALWSEIYLSTELAWTNVCAVLEQMCLSWIARGASARVTNVFGRLSREWEKRSGAFITIKTPRTSGVFARLDRVWNGVGNGNEKRE